MKAPKRMSDRTNIPLSDDQEGVVKNSMEGHILKNKVEVKKCCNALIIAIDSLILLFSIFPGWKQS